MVCVFGLFGTLSSLELKQTGVGLAVAVLIDATVIRAVLLPATMKLLGELNWYLPRRLRSLLQVRSAAGRATTSDSPALCSSGPGSRLRTPPAAT
jgi:RND superfamily putative drug exporter